MRAGRNNYGMRIQFGPARTCATLGFRYLLPGRLPVKFRLVAPGLGDGLKEIDLPSKPLENSVVEVDGRRCIVVNAYTGAGYGDIGQLHVRLPRAGELPA